MKKTPRREPAKKYFTYFDDLTPIGKARQIKEYREPQTPVAIVPAPKGRCDTRSRYIAEILTLAPEMANVLIGMFSEGNTHLARARSEKQAKRLTQKLIAISLP